MIGELVAITHTPVGFSDRLRFRTNPALHQDGKSVSSFFFKARRLVVQIYTGLIDGAPLMRPQWTHATRPLPARVLSRRLEHVTRWAQRLHVRRVVRPAVGERDAVVGVPTDGQEHAAVCMGAPVLEAQR